MLIHRLLDAFFRTLDAVDAARDRVDRILGREPRPDPWAVEWPPPASAPHTDAPVATKDATAATEVSPAAQSPAKPEENGSDLLTSGETTTVAVDSPATSKKTSAAKRPAKQAKTSAKKTGTAAKPTAKKPAAKKQTAKKDASSKRKGSVDRQGKDFDSPRARAVSEFVRESSLGIVSPEAEHDGKKVLARVLWALHAAEQAGSEKGLTSADASALLHLSANIEVFATNLARACRDHADLIQETEMDGRSKRYKLTAAGKAAAAQLEVS